MLPCFSSDDRYLHRCQNAGWPEHKKSCRSEAQPFLSLDVVRERVNAAVLSGNTQGVLRWDSRIDELAETFDPVELTAFAGAYCSTGKFSQGGAMYGRISEACGALQRVQEQVQLASTAGAGYIMAGDFGTAVCLSLKCPVGSYALR